MTVKQPITDSFSSRVGVVKPSAVREILKVTERPDVISFAGGMPAPELFPVREMAAAFAEVLEQNGKAALQYSTTEGWRPLRSWISDRLKTKGIDCPENRVLITAGSQQGIDMVCRVFLDPGDAVLVENPSYVAALQVFRYYGASLIGVDGDDDGILVDEAEAAIRIRRPKLIYLVNDFQNPKGTTLALDRRRSLLEVAEKYGIPIVEDDPYGELRYRGEAIPPLAAFDSEGLVIYLSTFSKTLTPGTRIGWIAATQSTVGALTVAKQAADLHTSTICQHGIAKLLESFDYQGHIGALREAYGSRCEVMLESLRQHMPEGTSWTIPDGGLFVWVRLPDGIDGEELLVDALEQKVAFVPGAPFYAENPQPNYIRLNFSNRPEEKIKEGIGRLGELVAKRVR